jgi:4-diphosphocytidyl-2-C-methyl-D-erythritol kinase
MIIKSFAKINLSLKVLGIHEDGFHELQMVMLPLDLFDAIEIETLPSSPDSFITCDDIELANLKENLCKKALIAMRNEFKFKENFMIRIHKEIPFAAGLGGGSSNAAAVILAVNQILKLHAPFETLVKVASTVGSDCPFFLLNKPALVEGIGEKISPIKVKVPYDCLIVKPQKGLSTKAVYAICDKFPKARVDNPGVVMGLANGDDILIAKSIGNDLMAPAESLLPEVGEIYDQLNKDGFGIVSMSGSGSSLFALSRDNHKCKDAAKKYTRLGYVVRLCKVLL